MRSIKVSEKGQALVVIALASVVLIGFAALAIDGSAKFSDRRHAQNAADTAALAAALEKVNEITDGTSDLSPTTNAWATCPPPTGVLPSPVCDAVQIAALDRADSNGYDNNPATNTVEVYSPPISGYYSTVSNSESYVQVVITSHVQTTFMRIFGVQETDNIVGAVAYMNEGGKLADGAMIIAYDPSPGCSGGLGSGGGSVDIQGAATINLSGGGIFVNSDETCGYASPNCPTLNIAGGAGISSVGSNNIDQEGCSNPAPEFPNQEGYSIPDDVDMPDEPTACSHANPGTAYQTGTDTYHITPGYYTDFPQKSINGNLFGKKQHIIMDPGVYCTDSDIAWSGQTFLSLDGSSGVTIYIKSGHKFSLNIDKPITLYASHNTGSEYDGYLIVVDGTHTDIQQFCTITGGAYLDLEGIIFAPYCNIKVNGDSGATAPINAQLVGWHILIDGGAGINFNYNPDYVIHLKRKIGLMK